MAVPIFDVVPDEPAVPEPIDAAVKDSLNRAVVVAGFVLAGVVGYLIGLETRPVAPLPLMVDAQPPHFADHRPPPAPGRPLVADSAEMWYRACVVGLPVSADAHERAATDCW